MAVRTKRSLGLFFILLWVTALSTGCGSKEEKIAGFVGKGNRLLEQKEPVRAILEFKNALQIDPKTGVAFLGLGKAYLMQEEHQKGYNAFRSALELDPGMDEARLQIAQLMAVAREGKRALDELQQLKNPQYDPGRVALIRARALISLGEFQQALGVLKEMPGSEDARERAILTAQALRGLGGRKAVEDAVSRWRSLDPSDTGSYLFLAAYYAELNEKSLAAGELEKMVAAAPKDPGRMLLRAQGLEQLGLMQETEAAFASLPPGQETLKAQANYWRRRGDVQKAKAMLEQLLALDEKNVQVVIALAQLLADEKEVARAMALLDRSLSLDVKRPDREQLLIARATLKAGQEDWDDALKTCAQVLQDNQANMDAHLLMGKVLLATKMAADAEIHLNQVATARPEDADVQILLARCRLSNKKDGMAEDGLVKAIEANPKSVPLRLTLASFYYGRNDLVKAERVLNKGLELMPDDVFLLRTLGQLEAARNNALAAGERFEKIVKARPDLPLGYLEMGQLAMAQSQADQAVAWFEKALDKQDGWKGAVPGLIRAFTLKGAPQKAVALVQRLMDEARLERPLLELYLGQALLASGDTAASVEAFKKAIELAPGWLDPYRELARVYVKEKDLPRAIAELEQMYKKQPSAQLGFLLGTLYEYGERYADALRIYGETAEGPNAPPIVLNNLAYLLAEISVDKEDLQKADGLISKALAREPENSSFLDTAAWVAYKKGDLQSARIHIQNSIALSPEAEVHNLHAAIICSEMGEKGQAEEYAKKALKGGLSPKDREKALTLVNVQGGNGSKKE